MDIITIQQKIEENIKLLRATSRELKKRSIEKANAKGEYEKKIAIVMLKLRNSESFEFEDIEASWSGITGLKEIAKGFCYQESINLDLAESNYKNAVLGMQALMAEINALQSILRYMEE